MRYLSKPAVQSYANGALSGANEWCGAVAPQQGFIFSTGPADEQQYVTAYDFESGAVLSYADINALGVTAEFQSTLITDRSGNIWTFNTSVTMAVPNTVTKLTPGAPWAVTANWGSTSEAPPDGVGHPGSMAWVTVGNASYLVGGAFAMAGVGTDDVWVLFANPGALGFAGHQFQNSGGSTAVCTGSQGATSGSAFWTSRPFSIFGTDYSLGKTTIEASAALYSVGTWPTTNPGITSAIVKSYVPTDFDAAWGAFTHFGGPAYDQTDGNVLIQVSGSGGGNPNYIAKLDTTTGAVLWKVAVIHDTGFDDDAITSSVIQNGLFLYYDYQGTVGTGSGTLYVINTADGTFATTASILSIGVVSQQSSNDHLGCVIGNGSWNSGFGPLSLLNATPSSGGGLIAAYFLAAAAPAQGGAIGYTRMFGSW